MSDTMKYQLQSGKYGGDWQDEDDDYPRDQSDLRAWIEIAEDADSFDGKYQYRIVDQKGTVVWRQYTPREGVPINQSQPPSKWLRNIQRDYGIPDDLFAQACREWLKQHAKK